MPPLSVLLTQSARQRAFRLGLVLASGFTPVAVAQNPDTSAHSGDDSAVSAARRPRRVNLERYLFPSPSAEAQARIEVSHTADTLARTLSTARHSVHALARALVLYDSLTAKALRHWWYLRLRAATDLTDRASAEAADQVSRELDGASARIAREIAIEDKLGRLGNPHHVAGLSRYAFFIEGIRRSTARTLPADQERIVDSLKGPATTWEFPTYLAITSHVQPAPAAGPRPSQAERAASYRARFENVATFGDLYATTLVQTVRGRDAVARVYGYPNAPAQVYSNLYLAPENVRATLAAVRARADLAKRYERAQLGRAGLSVLDSSVGPWDVAALREAGTRIGLDSGAAAIERALAPLGTTYGSALAAMLAPRTERLDLGPGAHRTPGGFSFGTLGFPAGVYLASFDSTPTAVRRLAHESAHAMHRQLMAEAGTAPVYFSGASYLSEAVALFNELVVTDYLAGAGQNHPGFEEAFLDKALDVFYGAEDAELELAVYDGVEAGRLHAAADFDSVSRKVDEAYTIWAAREPGRAHRWMLVRLMWEDPLYLINYVYADLIGLKLFTLYQSDPASFAPRYLAFLQAGYSDAPATLLWHHFGIRLNPEALLRDATDMLGRRLDRYEHPAESGHS